MLGRDVILYAVTKIVVHGRELKTWNHCICSRLLRFTTARGSCTGLVTVGLYHHGDKQGKASLSNDP